MQIGMRGPFEIPYEEGDFVPVPHNFVIVGPVGYWGHYWIIGTICFYFIAAFDMGGGTIASTTGVSYFDGLPRGINLEGANCNAGDVLAQQAFPGIGYNARFGASTARIYPPSWAASAEITVSGFYFIV
jgi:hypothetical protein